MKNQLARAGLNLYRLLLATAMALTGWLLMSKVGSSIAGRVGFGGSTDSFQYSARVEDAGYVEVLVSVRWEDPQAMQTYIDANLQRGNTLVAKNTNAMVPVQITFVRPMPIEDVRILVAQTNFQVDNFILVGYSTVSKQRGTYFRLGALAQAQDRDSLIPESERLPIPERELMDPATGDELVFDGLMVLEGQAPASVNGLGQWLNNPDAYLVDTSTVEVLEIIRGQHAAIVANNDIEVSLESPFWLLDW